MNDNIINLVFVLIQKLTKRSMQTRPPSTSLRTPPRCHANAQQLLSSCGVIPFIIVFHYKAWVTNFLGYKTKVVLS